MTHVLVDTSVLIKWFHAEGERDVADARAIRDAHVRGDLTAHVLDLALYEVGNVLARSLRWDPVAIAEQLDDLLAIVGPPLSMAASWLHGAADLAHGHRLTFYDASWAAAARGLAVALVSADAELVASGLASSPATVVARFGLSS